MTHLARLMILVTFAAGPTAALADGYSGTVTGPNGGTTTYSGKCTKGEASVYCTRDGVYVGPNGHTSTRSVESESTATGVKKKITTTGPLGRTVVTTRERLR